MIQLFVGLRDAGDALGIIRRSNMDGLTVELWVKSVRRAGIDIILILHHTLVALLTSHKLG